MKLLVVIPSFYPAVVHGGPIFSSLNTCKELSKKGIDVRVATTNSNMYDRLDVPVNTFIPMDGFHVKYYNETIVGKFSFRLCTQVWRDIKQADIIHIQSIFNTPVPVALLYAKIFNKPVLLSPRGVMGDWVMNQGNSLKKLWLFFFIRYFANKIVWHATSEQEKKEIEQHFPKATITCIPNGISVDTFDKAPYLSKKEYLKYFTGQDCEVTEKTKVLISLARLHKKKGFDILIEAFQLLMIDIPDIFLLIAGQDEGELEYLQQLVVKYKLEARVFFVGSVDGEKKVDFLIHADVFALSSHNENFGNVYAEALAAGTPILASIHTPWMEVEMNNCGRCVDLDPLNIKQALMYLLGQDRNKMNVNSKNFIKKYSWERISDFFIDIFNQIKK